MARNSRCVGHRIIGVSDNLACVGCISRGRSKARPLDRICRHIAAFLLGSEITFLMRWVESRRNYLDGPSRGEKLGYLDEATGRVLGPPEKVVGALAAVAEEG